MIGDDASDISRVATPLLVREGKEGVIPEEKVEEKGGEDGAREKQDVSLSSAAGEKGKAKEAESASGDAELPEEVRRRLAKLESLSGKYQGMLSHEVIL